MLRLGRALITWAPGDFDPMVPTPTWDIHTLNRTTIQPWYDWARMWSCNPVCQLDNSNIVFEEEERCCQVPEGFKQRLDRSATAVVCRELGGGVGLDYMTSKVPSSANILQMLWLHVGLCWCSKNPEINFFPQNWRRNFHRFSASILSAHTISFLKKRKKINDKGKKWILSWICAY